MISKDTKAEPNRGHELRTLSRTRSVFHTKYQPNGERIQSTYHIHNSLVFFHQERTWYTDMLIKKTYQRTVYQTTFYQWRQTN